MTFLRTGSLTFELVSDVSFMSTTKSNTYIHNRDSLAGGARVRDIVEQVLDEDAALSDLAVDLKLLTIGGLELDLLSRSRGHDDFLTMTFSQLRRVRIGW